MDQDKSKVVFIDDSGGVAQKKIIMYLFVRESDIDIGLSCGSVPPSTFASSFHTATAMFRLIVEMMMNFIFY